MKQKQSDILEVFGKNLQKKRLILDLGQRDFGEIIGIHNADLSRMERGKINIGLKKLHSIAKALDMNPLELLIGV